MKSSIRVYLRLADNPYQEVHFDTAREGDIALKDAVKFWEQTGHAMTKIIGKKRTLIVPSDVVACVMLYKYDEKDQKSFLNKKESKSVKVIARKKRK